MRMYYIWSDLRSRGQTKMGHLTGLIDGTATVVRRWMRIMCQSTQVLHAGICAVLHAAYPSPPLWWRLSWFVSGSESLDLLGTCRRWTPCTIPANPPPSRRGWPVSSREPGNAVRQSPQNRRHPISTPTETPIRRWPDRGARAGAPVCIYLVAERHFWIAQERAGSISLSPNLLLLFFFSATKSPIPLRLSITISDRQDRHQLGVPSPH